MLSSYELYEPTTIAEACALKQQGARPVAGGTDIYVAMHGGSLRPEALVDLKGIEELRGIAKEDDHWYIGALTPHRYFEESDECWRVFTALAEGCSQIGSVQIRQRGTIGGNICNAVPSADSVGPLLVYDTDCVIASANGEREVPLAEFFTGPKQTVLKDDELLKGVKVYLPAEHSGSRYIKYTRRKAMDLALCGASVLVTFDNDRITKARAALTTSAPTAIRAAAAEEYLLDKAAQDIDYEAFGRLCVESASPRTSWRSSAGFRQAVIAAIAADACRSAVRRAQGEASADMPKWREEVSVR